MSVEQVKVINDILDTGVKRFNDTLEALFESGASLGVAQEEHYKAVSNSLKDSLTDVRNDYSKRMSAQVTAHAGDPDVLDLAIKRCMGNAIAEAAAFTKVHLSISNLNESDNQAIQAVDVGVQCYTLRHRTEMDELWKQINS